MMIIIGEYLNLFFQLFTLRIPDAILLLFVGMIPVEVPWNEKSIHDHHLVRFLAVEITMKLVVDQIDIQI